MNNIKRQRFKYKRRPNSAMQRTLIRQGGGGYTIYLPKKWVDRKGLKGGQKIHVVETETALIIESAVAKKKEAAVEITEANAEDIQAILTHLYRRGFDIITLTGQFDSVMPEIKLTVKDLLLGFEITERDKTHCKIASVSEPSEQNYDTLLRRIFLIIKETQNIILADFQSNKFAGVHEIEELKKQQDKYILFCRRILVREKYSHPTLEWELLTFLMHIEHAYYYMYKYAIDNKVKISSRVLELLTALNDYFQLYYDAFYKKDIKYIHEINRKKKTFQFGRCFQYLSQTKGKESVLLCFIREIFRLIQVGSSPVLSGLFEAKLG